jgi:DNA polymerase III delta prime subunit
MKLKKKEWSLVYRPYDIKDYIFPSEDVKRRVEHFISTGSIPHLFLYGPPGTGKTTLALLLKHHLNIDDMDFMRIDGSKENSVDVMRNKIDEFTRLATISECGFKIVYIDECDYLSLNAQATLRTMMENRADNVTFILSCNYPHKIMKEIKSRCAEGTFEFKTLDRSDMCVRMLHILKDNDVSCETDEDFNILEEVLNKTYPDFRRFIDSVHACVLNGKLVRASVDEDKSISDKVELLESVGNEKINWESIRNLVSGNISDDEFLEYYRFFYEYLQDVDKFKDSNKWKAGIIIIADCMYKHSLVADKEINFMAMLIKLHGL